MSWLNCEPKSMINIMIFLYVGIGADKGRCRLSGAPQGPAAGRVLRSGIGHGVVWMVIK